MHYHKLGLDKVDKKDKKMKRTEFVIPSVRTKATDERIRKDQEFYCTPLEPFAPRHSITYFNNGKKDSSESAHHRLHTVVDFDPKKPRCDRARQSLYWIEIYKENEGHAVPMTSNHWYGRPNRIQVDYPEKKFNRSSKMQDFYTKKRLNFNCQENKHKIRGC